MIVSECVLLYCIGEREREHSSLHQRYLMDVTVTLHDWISRSTQICSFVLVGTSVFHSTNEVRVVVPVHSTKKMVPSG